jgi:hypothetical protein
MTTETANRGISPGNPLFQAEGGVNVRSMLAFAAIGDHARLPWRFFARLNASDGSLLPR